MDKIKELTEDIVQHFNDSILDGWSAETLAEYLINLGYRKEENNHGSED